MMNKEQLAVMVTSGDQYVQSAVEMMMIEVRRNAIELGVLAMAQPSDWLNKETGETVTSVQISNIITPKVREYVAMFDDGVSIQELFDVSLNAIRNQFSIVAITA